MLKRKDLMREEGGDRLSKHLTLKGLAGVFPQLNRGLHVPENVDPNADRFDRVDRFMKQGDVFVTYVWGKKEIRPLAKTLTRFLTSNPTTVPRDNPDDGETSTSSKGNVFSTQKMSERKRREPLRPS